MTDIYIYICIVSIGSNVPAIKLFLVDNRERNTLTTVSIVLPLQINFSPRFTSRHVGISACIIPSASLEDKKITIFHPLWI